MGGANLSHSVSESQNAYFPILILDAALLAVALAPDMRKKSTLMSCNEKIY